MKLSRLADLLILGAEALLVFIVLFAMFDPTRQSGIKATFVYVLCPVAGTLSFFPYRVGRHYTPEGYGLVADAICEHLGGSLKGVH